MQAVLLVKPFLDEPAFSGKSLFVSYPDVSGFGWLRWIIQAFLWLISKLSIQI